MKTMVMNYARTLDEMIPDATTEVVMNKCDDIHNDIKNALTCALMSAVWTGTAIMDTAELTAIASKTGLKEIAKKTKKVVDSCKDDDKVVIVRR